MGSYVEFKNVKKVYRMGEVLIEALHDATFEIEKGEVCVIVGASGAGKTTLLNILGGMDTLSDGQVLLDGKDISRYSRREMTDYRRYEIGALDYNTGKSILKLLQDTSRQQGMTVVIITHNTALTAMADRIIHIKNGHISSVEKNEHITPVEDIEW